MELSPGNSWREQEKPLIRRGICKAERFQTVLATCRVTFQDETETSKRWRCEGPYFNWDSLGICILALYLYFDPEYKHEGYLLELFVPLPNVSLSLISSTDLTLFIGFWRWWPDQNWDRGYDSKFERTRHNFGLPVTQNELIPGREERWTFPAVVGVISSRTVFISQSTSTTFYLHLVKLKKQLGTVFRILKQVWPLVVPSWSLQALQSELQALLPCFPFDPFEYFGVLLNSLGSCHLVLFCWKVLGYKKTEAQLWLRQQPSPIHGKRQIFYWDSVWVPLHHPDDRISLPAPPPLPCLMSVGPLSTPVPGVHLEDNFWSAS